MITLVDGDTACGSDQRNVLTRCQWKQRFYREEGHLGLGVSASGCGAFVRRLPPEHLQPLEEGREGTVMERLDDLRAQGIEINIDHAGEDGCAVKQPDALEAAFPEMARAVVFAVGTPGNGLLEELVEPVYF